MDMRALEKYSRYPLGVLAVAAGMVMGILARVLAPFDPRPAVAPAPRPADSFKGLGAYLYRRNYRGRHYGGKPVGMILDALAA